MALLLALKDLWPEFTPDFNPNHCILATKVAIEVGRYFGVNFEPMPVSIAAFNQVGWEQFSQGIEVKDWPPEAWSVGVHSADTWNQEGNRWDGHLIISGSGVLADLNADQLSRPERGITIENWVALRPDTPPPWNHTQEDGTHLVLSSTQATLYRQAKDWKTNYKPVTGEAIRILRKRLEVNDG
jgi:hypothetical protein